MRQLYFHRRLPFILVGGATAGALEGFNLAVIAILGLLLFLTNWRFLKLLHHERQLKKN